MSIKHLNIDHMSMVFDTPTGPFKALDNVDLVIEKGEYVSLIGHSGCGKSTVLNVVAGLLQASTGGVVLDGTEVVLGLYESRVVSVDPPQVVELTVVDTPPSLKGATAQAQTKEAVLEKIREAASGLKKGQ